MTAIGVFDSGVGGLTVVREIMRQLPNETIYYFGDVKNCPYGNKNQDEILEHSTKVVDFLVKQGIKMLVIACNTATAAALSYFEEKLDIPVVGVVIPGARRAIQFTENNKVLVLGTHFTTHSKIYDKEIAEINSDILVWDKACPTFVPFIEAEGNYNKQDTENLIANELVGTKVLGMDTVILGCTHYPILKKDIENYYGSKIKVISSGRETAREVSVVLTYKKLHQKKSEKKPHKFFISEPSNNFENIASKWLNREIKAQVIDLD